MPGEGGQQKTLYNGVPWGQLARKVSLPRLRLSINLSLPPGRSTAVRGQEARSRALCQPCPGAGCAAACNCPSLNISPRAGHSRWCVFVPLPYAHHPAMGPFFIPHPRALMNWLCSNCWDVFLRKVSAHRCSPQLGRCASLVFNRERVVLALVEKCE